jgi:hypothetical protein
MKGLKKLALVTAIAAVAAGAQAELKALDDSTMSEMTGQKGLTIDLETKWTIGEFAYQDAGLVVLKDLSMGGNPNDAAGNSMLDNIRMEIDIAGSQAVAGGDAFLKYGFSNVKNLSAIHLLNGNTDADLEALAAGSVILAAVGDARFTGVSTDGVGGAALDNEVIYGDGDLKIHFTFTDAWQKAGGYADVSSAAGGTFTSATGAVTSGITLGNVSYDLARQIATSAVDFEFSIGQIALADSGYAVAGRLGEEVIEMTDHVTGIDATTTTTTLISDLSIRGYLGPADIHIENKGNGFGAGTANVGSGDADSKIHWDSFFKVTDLDVYIDIAGVQLSDIAIHNERGDTTSLNELIVGLDPVTGAPIVVNTAAFGFAHSKRDIFAVKDSVLNLATTFAGTTGANPVGFVDGIAINTRFKGDIDIGALSFGDTGTSIGAIYLTDVTSTTNWTISAH